MGLGSFLCRSRGGDSFEQAPALSKADIAQRAGGRQSLRFSNQFCQECSP